MQPSRTERLNGIVAALSEYIREVRGYDMPETAVLLDMAKLDLQTRIHAISDREFRALCEAIERRRRSDGRSAAAGATAPNAVASVRSELPDPVAFEVYRVPLRTRRMPVSRRRSNDVSARSRKAW
jgi:hypothetical protein